MAISSYYGRSKAQGSTQKVMLNLGEGLNEFLPPMSIRDGQLSACKNFYSPDGTSLASVQTQVDYDADTRDLGELAFYSRYPRTVPSLYYNPATSKATNLIDPLGDPLDISSLNWGVTGFVNCSLFTKPSGTVALYSSPYEDTILSYPLGGELADITLISVPFNVRSLCIGLYRVFALDDDNTLWWSKGGDETTWFGGTPAGVYVAADAGIAPVNTGSTEDNMQAIVSYRDAVYVFGTNSIWLFSGGVEYESFQFHKVISGVGVSTYYANFTQHNGLLYFVNKSKVYVFDGSSNPVIISEPVISNGTYANGILGGINPQTGFMSMNNFPSQITSDDNYLYLYSAPDSMAQNSIYGLVLTSWIYMYNFARKSWFKRTGFNYTVTSDTSYLRTFAFKTSSGDLVWATSVHESNSNIKNYIDMTIIPTGATVDVYEGSIVTKAFSANPSNNQSLSGIYLTWSAKDTLDSNFEVYVSDKAQPALTPARRADIDWDNFTLVHRTSGLVSTQEPQALYIPIASSLPISSAPFFRIGIKATGCMISIYGIELHYRLKGASR